MKEELLDHIICYQKLQTELVRSFLNTNDSCHDIQYLTDFPKKGEIILNGEIWHFRIHGVGVSFKNKKTGVIVDPNSYITYIDIFNTWRLSIYLESIGINISDDEIESFLKQNLGKYFDKTELIGYYILKCQK